MIVHLDSGSWVSVPHDQITSMGSSTETYYDPHDSRLFFSPTGRMLPKGQGVFTDYFIFFPTAWVGVSDHCMVGGGATVYPPASARNQFVYGGVKAGTSVFRGLKLSLTVVYNRMLSVDEGTWVAYGAATYGSRRVALTMGAPIALGEDAKRVPHMFVGGELQVARNVKFVSENWFLGIGQDETWRLFLAGFRFFRRQEALDLGFASFDDLDHWFLLPWLSVSFFWDW